MATGPAVPFPALPAAPPPISLLTSAPVLEGSALPAHWENGISWDPEICKLDLDVDGDFPVWWVCADEGGQTASEFIDAQVSANTGTKPVPDNPDVRTYRPWTARGTDFCQSMNRQRDRQGRARRNLEANLSAIIENELWSGQIATAASFENDFLTSSPSSLGGPHGYVTALAELEQALAECVTGDRMIHAQPRLVALWARNGLLVRSASGRRLETLLGTIVVPGAGYDGSGSGLAAGTIETSWAYGTGLVRVLRSEVTVTPSNDAEATDRSINDVTYRAERTVAAIFDGCCKVGVQADHDTELS